MKTTPPSRLDDFLRDADDLDTIASRLAEGDFALLGEATHGTREFYEIRQVVPLGHEEPASPDRPHQVESEI